jgi:hypothetical protein
MHDEDEEFRFVHFAYDDKVIVAKIGSKNGVRHSRVQDKREYAVGVWTTITWRYDGLASLIYVTTHTHGHVTFKDQYSDLQSLVG